MHIFIDESGSFVSSSTPGSWCVVAAYVVPERSRTKAEAALIALKRASGRHATDEVKLKDVSEAAYLAFLEQLGPLDGTLYCTAVDSGTSNAADVAYHQQRQIECLNENIPRIRHPEGRAGHQHAADRFARLSPQLYLQIVCQYNLVFQLISQALLYYVQRTPATLGRFRWRIDQKHHGNSVFDESFRALAPTFMQSYSIHNPQPMLTGADYRHFERFNFKDGPPTYLRDEYGIEAESGFNVRLVMSEDFAFVDSKDCPGVQIADLLASGLRRCLRLGYSNNDKVASRLGSLMVEAAQREPPLNLISITNAVSASPELSRTVREMQSACLPMIARRGKKARDP
ncbi:MAG TPA: DUF3800 domain-containing protein [Rhodanobacter sp.]|nr:DUF3800 domain-containing protein [Rhodanobacter sp.]